MTYSCIRIDPQSPSISHLAQKYKSLRLSALAESPHSFSSTYDKESQYTEEWWESRLQLPGRETFICSTHDTHTSADEGEWIAQVTLLGPVPAKSYALPEAAQQPPECSDEDEEKWQMLSLYTLPAHRGKGVGKMLCRETFSWLQQKDVGTGKQQHKQIRVRIMVKPENTATVRMYAGLGFVDAGKCTLAEALRANGDGEMVPEDGGGPKFNQRRGLIMAATLTKE